MSSIEESIHQVFSSLLSHIRENDPITFEEEVYKPQKGFIDQEGNFILDGSSGLIGEGHPLFIKVALEMAISGNSMAKEQTRQETIRNTNNFISKVLGFSVVVTNPSNNLNLLDSRVTGFLTDSSLKLIKKGETVNIQSFGIETFGIRKSEKPCEEFIGFKSIYSNKLLGKLIRFLDLGQFFGDKGLIKNREIQIKEALGKTSLFESNMGLTVKLKKTSLPKSLVSDGNHLIFPTSFDKEQLEKLRQLMEDQCSP